MKIGHILPPCDGVGWGGADVETFEPIEVKYNYKRKTIPNGADLLHYFDVVIYEDMTIKEDYIFQDCNGNKMGIKDGSIIKLCEHKVRFNAVSK